MAGLKKLEKAIKWTGVFGGIWEEGPVSIRVNYANRKLKWLHVADSSDFLERFFKTHV